MARVDTALQAAETGASIAVNLYEKSLPAETKSSKMDYVTEADVKAQRQIIKKIRSNYPDASIVGEEEGERKSIPETGDAWVIDPIDGTSNFVHEIPLWTTTVAVVRDGQTKAAVTCAPALDENYRTRGSKVLKNSEEVTVSEKEDIDTFCGAPILRYGPERDGEFGSLMADIIIQMGDIRRLGCAQLTLAMVASGSLDAAISAQPHPNPWDTIAGVHMVRQSGGTVTDMDGNQWEYDSSGIIATNGKIHEKVVSALKNHAP